MNKVEQFISTIRDSFIGSQQVYTEGSCYHFYRILKFVFPDAEAWFNQDHILTNINGRFYDITGVVIPGDKYEKLEEGEVSSHLNRPFNIYKLKR